MKNGDVGMAKANDLRKSTETRDELSTKLWIKPMQYFLHLMLHPYGRLPQEPSSILVADLKLEIRALDIKTVR